MGRPRARPVDPPNPSGKCQCGCGRPTRIAPRTITEKGHLKGEPIRHIVGHINRLPTRSYDVDPNPSGQCRCGCGAETERATRTYGVRGVYAGHHKRYAKGHNGRLRQRRQQQLARQRVPCMTCFESVPHAAVINGICALCLLRKRRQQTVHQQLQDREAARKAAKVKDDATQRAKPRLGSQLS